jgi:hypothetical protein
MTTRPYRAEDQGRQMAERLVALLTGTGGRMTAARRQPMAEPQSAADSAGIPAPPDVSWARAQLRERIQRAGAELAPTLQPPGQQPREADRSPYADKEPEP